MRLRADPVCVIGPLGGSAVSHRSDADGPTAVPSRPTPCRRRGLGHRPQLARRRWVPAGCGPCSTTSTVREDAWRAVRRGSGPSRPGRGGGHGARPARVAARWAADAAGLDPAELLAAATSTPASASSLRGGPAYPGPVRRRPRPADRSCSTRATPTSSSGPGWPSWAPATAPATATTWRSSWARDLSAAGVAIVSGLALGIDSAAHAGAVDADGRATDRRGRQRPRRRLPPPQRAAVARGGPPRRRAGPSTRSARPPAAWHFPARNRLIAALADVVVVVESHASGRRAAAPSTRPSSATGRSWRCPARCAARPRRAPTSCWPTGRRAAVARDADRRARGARAWSPARAARPPSAGPRPPPATAPCSRPSGWQPVTLDHLVLRTGRTFPDLAAALDRLEPTAGSPTGAAGSSARPRPVGRAPEPATGVERRRSASASGWRARPVPWSRHGSRPVAQRGLRRRRSPRPSPNTVAGLRPRPRRVRRVGRAPRASTVPRRVDRTGAAPLPRLPGHPPLRQAQRRPQGLDAAPLLRLAAPHRRASRSIRPPACRRPSGDGRLPRVLRDDELTVAARRARRPRSTTTRRPSACRDDAVLEILYGSGLRVAELCGLRPDDLDLAGGTVRVWGKGSKQRIVPLSAPAVEAARAVARRRAAPSWSPAESPADAVFLNRRGQRLSTPRRPAHPRPPRGVARRTPTRCATPSPRTCSTGVPTCVPCRRLLGHADLGDDAALHSRHQGTAPERSGCHPPPSLGSSRWTTTTRSAHRTPLVRLQGVGRRQAVREQLILHYSPLVKYVAGRVAVGLPQNVEQSDLVSYGIFGLIDAIEKFDPARGYKFETYAIARIKGAILDELRSIDWVPRSVRAKARALEKAYAKLESQLHRTPDRRGAGRRARPHRRPAPDHARPDLLRRPGRPRRDALGRRRPRRVAHPRRHHRRRRARARWRPTRSRRCATSSPTPSTACPSARRSCSPSTTTRVSRWPRSARCSGVTESRVCQIHTKAVLQLRSRILATEREPA